MVKAMTVSKSKSIMFAMAMMIVIGPILVSALTDFKLVEHELFAPGFYVVIFCFIVIVPLYFSKSNTEANHKQLKTIAYRMGFEFIPPQKFSVGQHIKMFFAGAWALNKTAAQNHNKKVSSAWACLKGEREGRPMMLRTFSRTHGRDIVTYTQFKLELISKIDGSLMLRPEGFGARFEKFFGAKDVQIGDSEFDEKFMIKADDEQWVKQVLDKRTRLDLLNIRSVFKGELSLKDNVLMYEEAIDFATDECRERFEKIIQVVWLMANQIDPR